MDFMAKNHAQEFIFQEDQVEDEVEPVKPIDEGIDDVTVKNVKHYVRIMGLIAETVQDKLPGAINSHKEEMALAIFKQFFDDQNAALSRVIQREQLQATIGRYL
jgi:hypothetical protein